MQDALKEISDRAADNPAVWHEPFENDFLP